MPTKVLPLVGSPTARGMVKSIGASSRDQQFINCIFESAKNTALQQQTVYCVKRAGCTASTISNGNTLQLLQHDTSDFGQVYKATVSGVVHLFSGSTDCGIVNVGSLRIADGQINGVTCLGFIGWYLMKDATTASFTFTGDTHTNTTIDNISSMTGLYVGQAISGTNIAADTRIATVNTAGSSITTTIATTGTSAGVTVTREAVAKIIDANWPSAQVPNSVVYQDGYFFWGTQYGRIYHSALNDPSTIPGSYAVASRSANWCGQIFKSGDKIIASPATSGGIWEAFYNAGNPIGSPLSRIDGWVYEGGTAESAVSYYNGMVYFVNKRSTSSLAETGLYRMALDGFPEKVSDTILDQIITDNLLYAVATVSISERTFICLCGTTISILFDPDSGLWSFITDTTGSGFNGFNRVSFTVNDTNGKLFSWSSGSTYTDNGSSYTMTIQLANQILNGGKGFTVNRVRLIADTQSSGSSTLKYSTDDYANFTTAGTFDLTAAQKQISRPFMVRSGQVAFQITDSGSNAWRGQALEIDWEPASI